MHSYQHNIKTFNNATRHLTRVERSLYRDLIELYYDTEQPLPAVDFDRLARRVIANSEEERGALRFVLEEFFELTGDVYTHTFCDEQIELYRANASAKSAAGKASAAARKKKADERKQQRKAIAEQKLTSVEQPLNECATNQKPLTSNQEPSNKKNIQKKSDFKFWKPFFDAYPENKKGGTDASAWKAAQREGLTDEDFEAMLADVQARARASPKWYSTYALGITRYISEHFWKTPITTETPGGCADGIDLDDDSWLDGLPEHVADKLFQKPDRNVSSVEKLRDGRSERMGEGIPPAIARRNG